MESLPNKVTCFLTQPAIKENAPLILFPHTGPWAHDSWGFNAMAQCFAIAGYAVLQVNFRGSTGYGRSFIRKSIGHWEDSVQQDIHAALQSVLINYSVDKNNIFIFGTSFGGYSALMQLIRGRGEFAAVAVLNAPTDMEQLLVNLPTLWKPYKNAFYQLIADPRHPAIRAALAQSSPLNQCEKITTPLLILYSDRDQIVTSEQSKKLYTTLNTLQRSCELMCIENEGHDLLAQSSNAKTLSAVLTFFQQHAHTPLS